MKKDTFKDFIMDQLSGAGDMTARGMFGGWGLYMGDVFFGIVHKGRLYLKTDESTRGKYEAAGMGPFSPGKGQVLKNYYETPPEVIEDSETLSQWAREAAGAGRK